MAFVDTVGSFIRPDTILQARQKLQKGEITKEELEKIEDVEIKKLVEQQVAIGLKIVNDGEFRRQSFSFDFFLPIKGISIYTGNAYENSYVRPEFSAMGDPKNLAILHVSDKLEFNPDHPEFKSFQYLKSVTPTGVTAKWLLPSPTFTFVFTGRNFEKHLNPPYTNNPDLLYADLSDIYGKTIQKLYDLGCRSIQIDEPTWLVYPSFFVSGKEAELEYSEKYVNCVLKVFLPILAKKPADLNFTMHFCRGNSFSNWDVSPAYDTPFISNAIKQLNFHGLLMEYDTSRCGTFDALEKLTSAQSQSRFYIGTVSTKTTVLETEAYVEGRIRDAAKHVPLEKLGLTTQCGFCTGIGLPQDTSEKSQWEKLELLVKVARKIWGSA